RVQLRIPAGIDQPFFFRRLLRHPHVQLGRRSFAFAPALAAPFLRQICWGVVAADLFVDNRLATEPLDDAPVYLLVDRDHFAFFFFSLEPGFDQLRSWKQRASIGDQAAQAPPAAARAIKRASGARPEILG